MRDMDLPELLEQADHVRDAQDTQGWQTVAEAIRAHREKTLQRLLNESTKPEDIPYLRGLAAGLAAMDDAAETILAYAADREAEARKSLEHA